MCLPSLTTHFVEIDKSTASFTSFLDILLGIYFFMPYCSTSLAFEMLFEEMLFQLQWEFLLDLIQYRFQLESVIVETPIGVSIRTISNPPGILICTVTIY